MYARRGQCFTTTKFITKLEGSQLQLIDDIELQKEDDPYEKYCFTDGCGNISNALCDMINEKFGLLQCSAYQVRLGGIKGVLINKPKLSEDDEEIKVIEYRRSQEKFKSQDYFLEVIRCATFSQGYLNRQVILLLSNLGVPDSVFLQHLENSINSLSIKAVLKNLEKIYDKSTRHNKSKRELAAELELFFGPSKIFG
jgi:RNA-dependent RNA polymerase